jgi:hypothetical protein
MKAMTVTHRGARGLLVSSAFSRDDYHAVLVDRGDTEHQRVAIATTWEANPSITEAQTRQLEPDPRIWAREYSSIPQSSASDALDPDAVAAMFRKLPEGVSPAAPVGLVDFSSGRSDAATWAVARWCWPPQIPEFRQVRERAGFNSRTGEDVWVSRDELDPYGAPIPNPGYRGPQPPVLYVQHIGGVEGSFWRGLPAGELVGRMAADFRAAGVLLAIGDQREAFLLENEFRRHGVRFWSIAWTNPLKIAAVERLRRWLREQAIVSVPHDKLKRELAGLQERITPSGAITYGARGSGHDDYAALLLTLAMADAESLVPLSPLGRYPRRRRDLGALDARYGGGWGLASFR